MKTLIIILLFSVGVLGQTYQISNGTITDHGNASTTNSIAWYFAQYGAGKTYQLTSNAIYNIRQPLTLPANSTLTSNANRTIRAFAPASGTPSMDDQIMLNLSGGNTVENLVFEGNREAYSCIFANSTNNITIRNCVLQNTKNDYTTTASGNGSSIIYINFATNVTITRCKILNAGCNPMLNVPLWMGWENGVLKEWMDLSCGICGNFSSFVEISNCYMDYTQSSSILMIGIHDWRILNNEFLHSTQLPLERLKLGYSNPWRFGASSAVTGYSWNMYNILVANNTISNYENDGIHFSGENISICNNFISPGYAGSIVLCDLRGVNASDEVYSLNNFSYGIALMMVILPTQPCPVVQLMGYGQHQLQELIFTKIHSILVTLMVSTIIMYLAVIICLMMKEIL